jgi:hypothetical protein
MKIPELTRRCENPTCPNRGRPWRVLRTSVEGAFLNGVWYCSPVCFEEGLNGSFVRMLSANIRQKSKSHRIPLGLVLLSLGLINEEHLKQALKAQRESEKGRLGDWLRNLGTVTEMQITQALARQWSLPIFPLTNDEKYRECAHLVPLPLLENSEMVPVHFLPLARQLYMAFAEGVDYTALYAVEQMLECRTEACLAPQSSLHHALDEIRRQPRPKEILYEVLRDPQGWAKSARAMAGTVRRQAEETGTQEVRLVACGKFLWSRLQDSNGFSDLLFQIISENGMSTASIKFPENNLPSSTHPEGA